MEDTQATLDFDVHLPPFPHHLLKSNDAPSEAEALEIQAILDTDAALVARLDNSLEEEHERIIQHVHQGRGILSVVRRLPFDILGELFFRLNTERGSVWLLGRVCRRWKAATLALPALWADIERDFPLHVIATHLENSKQCPLHITLDSSQTSALQLIVKHCERWESIKLDIGSHMVQILAQVHGKVPLLRRVEYRDGASNIACRVFEIAPRLLEASIRSGPPFFLPWAQLDRLFLQVQDNLHQIKTASSLVELNLLSRLDGPLALLPDPIQLPRLRRLFVYEGAVLNNMMCPSLEDIFIVNDRSMSAIPFIERSACHLRTFTTECRFASVLDIMFILDRLPTLVELRLTAMLRLLELLPHLAIHDGLRPQGLELRAIVLHGISSDDLCTLVVKMMESRRRSPLCPTPSLCVLNDREPNLSASASRTLSLLRDQSGLEVEWLTSNAAIKKLRSWKLDYPW